MGSQPFSAPAFGQADLSNCEREQIHLAGSIQPHGALLVVSEPDHVIVQASANAAEFLGLDADGLLGRSITELGGDLGERIWPHLDNPLHVIPSAVQCRVGTSSTAFDGLVHRPPEGGLVIELEPPGPIVDLSKHVEQSLRTIVACDSLSMLCTEAAKIFADLTGYDRVMVYRFDDEGHGEVFAEQRLPHLEPYLGMRYPASDIPQMARDLYIRNRVRLLVDVGYTPVPLTPRLSPLTGRHLDMSLCFLRSMSPIHIQYLQNMGVAATLVASLVVGGRLWGLFACHHGSAKHVHYETRAVCELLAETVATRIAALESFVQADAELAVRRLEQRMIAAVSRDGDWRSALFDNPKTLLEPLNATGAALLFEDQVFTVGEVPGTAELREIGKWLNGQPKDPVVATASLTTDVAAFEPLRPVASGILAIPVSSSPGEYLVWVRPEQIRTVTWGGDPYKPVVVSDDLTTLSPRRSFAKWHQLVEGTSEPWTPADMAAARLIGETVADIVIQFRSVRMLIAQDQLERASRQVVRSDPPVIIADSGGRILVTNESFEQLLQAGQSQLLHLDDLSSVFSDATEARRRLQDLLRDRRSWRGEVSLTGKSGEAKPLLVRADPVFSSRDRVLGFVILFADLRERKVAEDARRRFQEGVAAENQAKIATLTSVSGTVYKDMLSSVVGNAQLAALEITHGVDVARIPENLESVRSSVHRTAELLQHLMWHARSVEKED